MIPIGGSWGQSPRARLPRSSAGPATKKHERAGPLRMPKNNDDNDDNNNDNGERATKPRVSRELAGVLCEGVTRSKLWSCDWAIPTWDGMQEVYILCVYIYIYIYICTCIYLCVYIYIYIMYIMYIMYIVYKCSTAPRTLHIDEGVSAAQERAPANRVRAGGC